MGADYATLKLIHVGCAMLGIAGFVVRGALMLGDSPLLRAVAFVLALVTFAYIVSVAVLRTPAGAFASLGR